MKFIDCLKERTTLDFAENELIVTNVNLYKKTKTIELFLKIKSILRPNDFKALHHEVMSILTPLGLDSVILNVEYENKNLDDSLANEYYNAIMLSLSEKNLVFKCFLDLKHIYSDGLFTVTIDRESVFLNEYLPQIKQSFNKAFLNVDFKLEVDESLKTLSEIQQEEMKQTISLMEHQERKAEEEQHKREVVNLKPDYRKKVEVSSLSKINEIPQTQEGIFTYREQSGEPNFMVEGEIFSLDLSKKKVSYLLKIEIFDDTDSICVNKWVRENELQAAEALKIGDIVNVQGKAEYNTFQHEVTIQASSLNFVSHADHKSSRTDNAQVKRVELHMHTKMSNLDGLNEAADIVKTVTSWGHKAIAFTDRNGVYAIPDINHATEKNPDFKPIYGCELDYIDDYNWHITYDEADIVLKDATYVVFDIETTGFSQTYDEIIEIGAHKVKGGIISETFSTFINPGRSIPNKITELTSITDEMVKDAPGIVEALNNFMEFSKGAIWVAHNADFDIGMIHAKLEQNGLPNPKMPGIDTLNLCRALYGDVLSKFNLKAICKFFKVKQEHHHRATDDTRVTAECFLQIINDVLKTGIVNYKDINSLLNNGKMHKHIIPSRINVIAKNQVGYKNMYKLLSDALTTHLAGDARLLHSVLDKYHEGVLTTSSGSFGAVFENALNRSTHDLEVAMESLDIIEVQPLKCYNHLIDFLNDGHDGEMIIKETIKKIINTAKSLNKIVVATSDAYYIEAEQQKYRDILIASNQVGGGVHELSRYKVSPDAHLRTTDEMLAEFSYLDKDLAYEIVVTNTNLVADMIDRINCFHKEMFVPADDEFADHPDPKYRYPSMIEEMKHVVEENVLLNYGENPHPFVRARVDRELRSIISSGYYSTYFMAYLMVKDSVDHGYLVGSRGSVGSSFVATMMNITEVNPLPPHYLCPKCKFMAIKFSEEEEEKINSEEERKLQDVLRSVGSGYDLPDMTCPCCGEPLKKDGHDIPFETFLGFNGDKVPDIDLNFSGEYQPRAHLFVRHLIGYDNSFRGGTVATIADKNGFGYVKAYAEKKGLQMRSSETGRIATNLIGIKRSTGQHPGGIVVVPKRIDIFDVTPIQYPANDDTVAWRTTHFDYHAFEDNLLKLDILGHDDPTLIKYFMDIVHEHQDEFPFSDARKIPVDDKKVFSLFGSTEAINVKPEDIDSDVASYAVPEFGTTFVRQMLIDTKPTTFAGLVKISGLSHGTDVWLGNAKELVNGTTDYGTIGFDKIIGCRDDIMVDLMFDGLEPLKSFKIMEFVRKGKVAKDPETWKGFKEAMIEKKVPEWYIWSCEQIKYMFPKAHATAYVLMALRIAWFKVYKPAMFYSAYFSKRAKAYDVNAFLGGAFAIREKIQTLSAIKSKTAKDEDLITALGVALEAVARGIKFLPVDINKSDSSTFVIEGDLVNGNLRLPFAAVDGLGPAAAESIKIARDERPFSSKEDMLKRTKLNKTLFDLFDQMGALGDLPEADKEEEVGLFAFL